MTDAEKLAVAVRALEEILWAGGDGRNERRPTDPWQLRSTAEQALDEIRRG